MQPGIRFVSLTLARLIESSFPGTCPVHALLGRELVEHLVDELPHPGLLAVSLSQPVDDLMPGCEPTTTLLDSAGALDQDRRVFEEVWSSSVEEQPGPLHQERDSAVGL
jgi:hypothetical protein